MAESLWLVYKTESAGVTGQKWINDMTAVIINADDTQSATVTMDEATSQLRVGGYNVPDGYFTTAVVISDLTSGPLADDLDCYAIFGKNVVNIPAPA